MSKLSPKELSVNGKRARLLVDDRFLERYDLQEVATRVRERMIPYDEESFALLRDRQDPFAFEKDMAATTYFDKRAVKRILPFAVTDTWQYDDRLAELAECIAGYDVIHAFRLDPIVQVMSAWLCRYHSRIDQGLELLQQHPALEPDVSYPTVANPDPLSGPPHERVQFVKEAVQENRNPRATGLLLSSFTFGLNKNLLRLGLLQRPGVPSSIIYTFDRNSAEAMMVDVIKHKRDHSPSFRQGIDGEIVVNAEDLVNDAVFEIVYNMLYHNHLMSKVHVHHQGKLVLTIDRSWLKDRIATMKKKPGDFFALGKKFIPMVKARLGEELESAHPDVQMG